MRRCYWALLAFAVIVPVQAQECSQILTQGIYDIRSSANDLATASSFSQWFCDNKFSSAKQTDDFGASLAFPFKGIPIKLGFDSSSQSWSEWYSSFCARVQSDQSLQSRVREHVQTVNPQIVQAFNSCIESDGLHVWLERTYDPKKFRFAARFNPPNEGNSKATIKSFETGSNVSCENKPTTISRPVWRTHCVRKNDDPVSLVVTSDWNPKGGGSLDLPAISRQASRQARCSKISIQAQDFDKTLSENVVAFSVQDPRPLYGGLVGTARADGSGPSTAAYKVRFPVECAYDISIEFASAVARPVYILLNGEPISTSALGEATGGFGSDRLLSQRVARRLSLGGDVTITIKTVSSQAIPHLKQIIFEPVR
jgi:hypothetical protein